MKNLRISVLVATAAGLAGVYWALLLMQSSSESRQASASLSPDVTAVEADAAPADQLQVPMRQPNRGIEEGHSSVGSEPQPPGADGSERAILRHATDEERAAIAAAEANAIEVLSKAPDDLDDWTPEEVHAYKKEVSESYDALRSPFRRIRERTGDFVTRLMVAPPSYNALEEACDCALTPGHQTPHGEGMVSVIAWPYWRDEYPTLNALNDMRDAAFHSWAKRKYGSNNEE